MTYKIIGFTGLKGSGKDTAAQMTGGQMFAFASELKATARKWYGLSWEQVYGDQKEVVDPKWGLTPREIMQRLGTEVARSIHPETWTRYLLDDRIPAVMAIVLGPPRLAVITDVRFPNEVSAIHERGGHVIRINRLAAATNQYSAHESESHIRGLMVDYDIDNNGTLDELRSEVVRALNDMGVYRG